MTQFNQMLDLFVLRPVGHRAGDTGCSPWGGQIKGSPMHTNTMQLQKHLAAVLFISPNSSSDKRLKEQQYFFQLLIDIIRS